ncbi:hypothetical protein EF910_31990 [Streptomyces sp. WAC07149]|uniref:hypothetical protein n=1 Tax=Streptomyces sp. WAC07149 TaxID=2487425 RepID=UPI000F76B8C6|nr:hypothetical protein [Streptomyces sp. WAC07149]RST00359.1 hypothetical protein EF910_31990 [Streptomyces sp. WAC07149]
MTTDTRAPHTQIQEILRKHELTNWTEVVGKGGELLAYRAQRVISGRYGKPKVWFYVITLDGRYLDKGIASAGAVTRWVRDHPEAVAPVVVEPEPEEIPDPEYAPVAEWSGDWWHHYEDYDPQTVRRRILCDGEWYEAHAVSGPAWPMTVRHLSTFTMVGTLSERTALEAVAAHRVNLEAERAEAERVKVEAHREKVRGYGFTTADMDALNAAHRGQLPKNHPAIPSMVARGWLVPMIAGSDVLTYSEAAEVAKIETNLGVQEGWLTLPEPELVACPGDVESVEFVEERNGGGMSGRLVCACRGCLPVKLSPVIRPDMGRAYADFASVPPGAFGGFVGALGYRMTGEMVRGTVTLSSGNVWAWRAPVTPIDGGGYGGDDQDPEPPTGPVAAQDTPEHVTTVTEVDGHHIPSCDSCGWVQDNAAFRGEHGEEHAQMRAAMHRRQPEFDTGALESPLAVGDAVWHAEHGAGRVKAVSGDTASVHLNLHLYPTDLPVVELRPFTEPEPVTCEIGGVEFTATWETRQYAVKWYGHTLQVGPTAGEVFRRLETGLRENPDGYEAEMAEHGHKTKQQGESTVGRGSMAPKRKVAAKVGDIEFSEAGRWAERAEILGHTYRVTRLAGKYEVTHTATGSVVLNYSDEIDKRPPMKRRLLEDAVARGPVDVEHQEQPVAEPSEANPWGPYERGQIVTVDGEEGMWCLMARAQNEGVWQAEPATWHGGDRREFKLSTLTLVEWAPDAESWQKPVDAKGKELRLGMLAVQNFEEQTYAGEVRRIYSNGSWLADVVRQEGSVMKEHTNRLAVVTQEQVAALAEPLPVEGNGHRGRIMQALVTNKAGKFRATCVCMGGMEIPAEGRSRAIAWFDTQAEAVAAWERHATVEPYIEDDQADAHDADEEEWNAEEAPEVEPGYAVLRVNPQGEKTDGTEGMWWTTCNGGREGCYEFGHIVSPTTDTSFRETEEAARALGEWHLNGEEGPAPTDRFPGQAEASRVVWAGLAYEFTYRAECTVCDAEQVFRAGKGIAKTAADKRRAVRDAAVAWTVEHAQEHGADTEESWPDLQDPAGESGEDSAPADTEESGEVGDPAQHMTSVRPMADTDAGPRTDVYGYVGECSCGGRCWYPQKRDTRTVMANHKAGYAMLETSCPMGSTGYVPEAEEAAEEECTHAGYTWLTIDTAAEDGRGVTLGCACNGVRLARKGKSKTSALALAECESCVVVGEWERVSDTVERARVEWKPKRNIPSMRETLEKHVGPDWEPITATAEPEFADDQEEPQAPAGGIGQISREQRRAAWRITAGEPAPVVKVTPVGLAGYVVHDGSNHVDLTVPPMLEAAPVRQELTVGQRVPIATPYSAPARTFEVAPVVTRPDTGRAYWESGERVTLNHRAGRTTSSRDGRVRVVWDDAPEWQGTFVPVEELWREGTEPQPKPVICGPQFFALVVPQRVDERHAVGRIKALATRVNEQHQEEPEPAPVEELDAPSMTWDEVSAGLDALWIALHEEQKATTPSRGWEEVRRELSALSGEVRRPEPVVMPVRVPRTLRRDLMTIAAAGALVTLAASNVVEVVPPLG